MSSILFVVDPVDSGHLTIWISSVQRWREQQENVRLESFFPLAPGR